MITSLSQETGQDAMDGEQILTVHEGARSWQPNENAAEALVHTVEWLTRFRVHTPRAERYATLSAWVYPLAPLPELELAYDIHAFFRIYDDFTDDLATDISRINVISTELTGILYGRPAKSQMGMIFNDLWTRQIISSPDQWVARISEHWEWYFNTQAAYAAMRDQRLDTTVEEYLELRLGNGAVPLCLVLGEKMNFTYLAPYIHHCTQLRLLRRLASDIIVYCNDVYSSVRDAKRDDPRNLITIIRDQDGCDWQQARARCEQEMRTLDQSIHTTKQRLDTACDVLRFTDAERAQARMGARIADDWNWGYQAWAAANELLMDTDPPREEISRMLTSPQAS
ncbi:terpene synthase family protein [Frankia sp. Mgl5]|uniref:terpene synthase family protein n=1 Tax=Frankia sp. Mgl5 TaxID=2933793 RepID=UPI0020104540|nr:terpene synthase family protein [Frankia sp. Mgl5]MCK9925827.1 terpene synthase family protein [Frankia sp. Mgl5]